MNAPTLREIRDLGQKGAHEQTALARVYGRRLSPYFTFILVRTRMHPDVVTGLGIACGILAGALLVFPLSVLHLASVLLYQLSYVLDFADGEVARLRGRSSNAGSYLDWLGHFYVPTVGAALLAIQVAQAAGWPWLLAGVAATIGLSAFHWSCREHIVVAYLRRHPEDITSPAVRNAMLDQPAERPAADGEDRALVPRRRPAVLSFLGALLLYPGAMHLLSLAIIADLAIGALGTGPSAIARQALLVAWAVGFAGHGLVAMRRNYRVLQRLDGLHGNELPWTGTEASSGSETRAT